MRWRKTATIILIAASLAYIATEAVQRGTAQTGYPSPTFQTLTVEGNSSIGGNETITGNGSVAGNELVTGTGSFGGKVTMTAATSATAPINLGQGSIAPTSPANGDCWILSTGYYCEIAGSTAGPFGSGTLSSSLSSAHIFVGNASNVATGVAMSGDVTISNTGATAVGNLSSVTNASLANTGLAHSSVTLGSTSVSLGGTTGISGTPISGLYLTSPVLTTPNLGTPSAGTLTNATGLPAAGIVAGALANGMTATTQSTSPCDSSTKVATTAFVASCAENSNTPMLLATLTASGGASITDTTHLTSSYKSYEIRIIQVTLGTSDAKLNLWVSTNGGSSYDETAADYPGLDLLTAAAAATVANFSAGLLGLQMPFTTGTSNAENGVVRIYAPSTTGFHGFDFTLNNGGASSFGGDNGTGQYIGSTSAINAIQLVPSTGTISGTAEIWGYP